MQINWNDLYYPIFNGNHNRVRNLMTAQLPKDSSTEPRIAPNQYVKRISPLPWRKK